MNGADMTLEQQVVDKLTEEGLTISTAESCTGGMIASRIINVPGASDVYNEGFITYSNDAKIKYLGVREETLIKYGAVSSQTAYEMAKGVCEKTGADVSVVSTGIAGPGGGTAEKPVGLVYLGCCVRGETVVKECHFKGLRQEIREMACEEALKFIIDYI